MKMQIDILQAHGIYRKALDVEITQSTVVPVIGDVVEFAGDSYFVKVRVIMYDDNLVLIKASQ